MTAVRAAVGGQMGALGLGRWKRQNQTETLYGETLCAPGAEASS